MREPSKRHSDTFRLAYMGGELPKLCKPFDASIIDSTLLIKYQTRVVFQTQMSGKVLHTRVKAAALANTKDHIVIGKQSWTLVEYL